MFLPYIKKSQCRHGPVNPLLNTIMQMTLQWQNTELYCANNKPWAELDKIIIFFNIIKNYRGLSESTLIPACHCIITITIIHLHLKKYCVQILLSYLFPFWDCFPMWLCWKEEVVAGLDKITLQNTSDRIQIINNYNNFLD